MSKIDAAVIATHDAEEHISVAMDYLDFVNINIRDVYADPAQRHKDLLLAIEEIKKVLVIIDSTSWPTMLDYAVEQKP
jgi:hypothetical protein